MGALAYNSEDFDLSAIPAGRERLRASMMSNPMQATHDAKTKLARRTLLGFTKATKDKFIVNWHHRLIAETIDDFLNDPERTRLIISTPPRMGKSELISRRLPAYYLGKNPDKEVIAVSYNQMTVNALGREVQKIMDSPRYIEIFPDSRLVSKELKEDKKGEYIRRADEFHIVNRSGKYQSAGIGGSLTSKGAHLAIIDDPIKNYEEAISPTRKEEVKNFYESTFLTRLYPGGKVIIVMTRWVEDDLVGELIKTAEKDSGADQWEILSLPAQMPANYDYRHPLDPRQEGEFLWPTYYTPKEMEKIKKTIGSKKWASLYQQDPKPLESAVFHLEDFRYYKELPKLDYVGISWDCTFKDTKDSDYAACTVWGVAGACKYLLHLYRGKSSFSKTLKVMESINAMFPEARFTVVEDKANGPAVIDVMKEKIPGLVGYTPVDSKKARAEAVAPQYEAGQIFLPDPYYWKDEKPWCYSQDEDESLLVKFIDEHTSFPNGANDDMVDSATQFLLKIRKKSIKKWLSDLISEKPNANLSKDEIAKIEAEQKMADLMGWDLPRYEDSPLMIDGEVTEEMLEEVMANSVGSIFDLDF